MAELKRILVIDDEEIVRVCCERVLVPMGYEVDIVSNGIDGLKMLHKKKYDVVFTDMKMPDMDGHEVVLNVRRLSPGTRVVVVTGYCTEEMREEVDQLGADYYIEKPFCPEGLVKALENI
jgi:CheY-like chemotaxis protein